MYPQVATIQSPELAGAATRTDTGSRRENLFFLLMLLVVMLGGAVRKWLTSSAAVGNAVLLVQMLLPFAMFAWRSARAKSPFQQFSLLYAYFFLMLLHIIHPLQLTPFHGMLGLIVHGLFWIGIFFYLANRELFRPERFIKLMILLSAAQIFLAFIQYGLPHDHILNKYAHEGSKQVATIGIRVRVSGLFSYISGYTAFLLFYPFLVWALIRLRYAAWFVAVAAVFGLIASFMTGSRSGTALYLAFMGLIILDSYPLRDIGKLLFRLLMPALVVFMLLLLARDVPLADQANEAYENFMYRVTQNRASGEESKRIWWDLWYFQEGRFKYPLTGIGLGATYQGAVALFGTSPYVFEFGYVEGEFVRILLEGGLIVLVFRLILITTVVRMLRLRNNLIRALVWLTMIYAAPITFNVHNAVFLMLGLMLIDNINWRQEQLQREILSSKSGKGSKDDQPNMAVSPGFPQISLNPHSSVGNLTTR